MFLFDGMSAFFVVSIFLVWLRIRSMATLINLGGNTWNLGNYWRRSSSISSRVMWLWQWASLEHRTLSYPSRLFLNTLLPVCLLSSRCGFAREKSSGRSSLGLDTNTLRMNVRRLGITSSRASSTGWSLSRLGRALSGLGSSSTAILGRDMRRLAGASDIALLIS